MENPSLLRPPLRLQHFDRPKCSRWPS